MRKKWMLRLGIGALLAMLLTSNVSAYSVPVKQNSYWYNTSGRAVAVPDSYALERVVSISQKEGQTTIDMQDYCIDANGNFYVLDTISNRIVVLDKNYKQLRIMEEFKDAAGQTHTLNGPRGITYTQDGNLLVADTDNHRILRMELTGKILDVLGAPAKVEQLEEGREYLPTKVASDEAGRLYVVAEGINMGFLELDSQGDFISYVGAPSVTPDAFTLFWRRFSTEEQLAQMDEFVPTEYNNITIDSMGFIYGTISALDEEALTNTIAARDKSGTTTPIRRLNPNGQDILRRQGTFPPVGDLEAEALSQMVDVAVNDTERYALLDGSKGRIFSYDSDGNLLSVFGSMGNDKGEFVRPTAISYVGDKLVILDAQLGQLIVYTPTEYGRLINRAVELNWQGEYEASYSEWEKIMQMNPHFDQAYIGVGKAQYMLGNYEKAMEYFKYAEDKEHYDEAFQAYRKEALGKGFGYLVVVLCVLVLCWAVVSVVKRVRRYVKGD